MYRDRERGPINPIFDPEERAYRWKHLVRGVTLAEQREGLARRGENISHTVSRIGLLITMLIVIVLFVVFLKVVAEVKAI